MLELKKEKETIFCMDRKEIKKGSYQKSDVFNKM
jgi:hypothetical protein